MVIKIGNGKFEEIDKVVLKSKDGKLKRREKNKRRSRGEGGRGRKEKEKEGREILRTANWTPVTSVQLTHWY